MDTKRQNDEGHYSNLARALPAQVRRRDSSGAIITADDDALIFALSNRDRSSRACRSSSAASAASRESWSRASAGVTGIVETQDIAETIELAPRAAPGREAGRGDQRPDRPRASPARSRSTPPSSPLAGRGSPWRPSPTVTAEELEKRLRELRDERPGLPADVQPRQRRPGLQPARTSWHLAGSLQAARLHDQGGVPRPGRGRRLPHRRAGARRGRGPHAAARPRGGGPRGDPRGRTRSINRPMFDDRAAAPLRDRLPHRLPPGSVRIEVPVPFYVQHRRTGGRCRRLLPRSWARSSPS